VIVNKTTAPGSGTFKTHRMLAGPPRGFERGDRVQVVVEGAEVPFAPPAAGGANCTRRAAGKAATPRGGGSLKEPVAAPKGVAAPPEAAGGDAADGLSMSGAAEGTAAEDKGPLAPPAYATSKEHAASWAVGTGESLVLVTGRLTQPPGFEEFTSRLVVVRKGAAAARCVWWAVAREPPAPGGKCLEFDFE
jgi:hypothetical protein